MERAECKKVGKKVGGVKEENGRKCD